MQASKLVALGFDICGGQIDYRGKNYGVVGVTGNALLEPDGEELVARLQSKGDAEDAVVKSETKAPAAKKAAVKSKPAAPTNPDPVGDGDDEAASLAAELKGLTGE